MTRRFFHFYHLRLLAELRFLLPLIFFLFFLLSFFDKNLFDVTKDQVLDEPGNTFFHQSLGHLLFNDNQLTAAKKEFSLSGDTVGLRQVTFLESQPNQIQDRIVFWEKISNQLPSYRDAYLQLAILNYQLYRDFDAKKFLHQALEIDPNNEVAKRLFSLL